MALGYDPSVNIATEATAHTPDPSKYHVPDNGMRGTMIPRSKGMGGSHGFVSEAVGVVNVINTDVEDNSLVATVDLGKISKNDVAKVAGEAGSLDDAWKRLGVLSQEVAPSDVKRNTLMSGYVVPPSTVGGAQLPYNSADIVPPVQTVETIMPATETKKGKTKTASRTELLLEQLVAGMGHLASQLATRPAAPAVAAEDETARIAPHELPQAPLDGLASLQIPWLTATPKKPTQLVYFDLGVGGTVSWRFHDVQVTSNSIILYHDDRWDNGGQWLPPYIEEGTIRVTVAATKQTYQVYSKDCLISLGVIEGCILPLAEEQPPGYSPVREGSVEAAHEAAGPYFMQ